MNRFIQTILERNKKKNKKQGSALKKYGWNKLLFVLKLVSVRDTDILCNKAKKGEMYKVKTLYEVYL